MPVSQHTAEFEALREMERARHEAAVLELKEAHRAAMERESIKLQGGNILAPPPPLRRTI